MLNCCRKRCLRGRCSTTFATWSLLVQFAGTNIVLMRGNRSSIHSLKPAEMCTFQQFISQTIFCESGAKPNSSHFFTCHRSSTFSTKLFMVTKLDQWFSDMVRWQPIATARLASSSFGTTAFVFPWNTSCNGTSSPLAVELTTAVICLLSSFPRHLTSFTPLTSYVCSVEGRKWIAVWSKLQTNSGGCPPSYKA